MAIHLRRFITSPLPAFEFEFISETRAPATLAAAAKCFALCMKVCFIVFSRLVLVDIDIARSRGRPRHV